MPAGAFEGFFSGILGEKQRQEKTKDAAEEYYLKLTENKSLRLKRGKDGQPREYKRGMTKVDVSNMFEENPDKDNKQFAGTQRIGREDLELAARSKTNPGLAEFAQYALEKGIEPTVIAFNAAARGGYQSYGFDRKAMAKAMEKAMEDKDSSLKFIQQLLVKEMSESGLLQDLMKNPDFSAVLEDIADRAGYDIKEEMGGIFKMSKRKKFERKTEATQPSVDANLDAAAAELFKKENPGKRPTEQDKQRYRDKVSGGAAQIATPGGQPEIQQQLSQSLQQPQGTPQGATQQPFTIPGQVSEGNMLVQNAAIKYQRSKQLGLKGITDEYLASRNMGSRLGIA